MVRVVKREPHMDRQVATWSNRDGIFRNYWDFLLADGRRLTVYRDLDHADRRYVEK